MKAPIEERNIQKVTMIKTLTKRWALIVAGLYGLILITLTLPAILLAFAPRISFADAIRSYVSWPFWIWLAVMVIGQLALLSVPVRVASRRPMTKGALWPAILAGGLMAGALIFAAICSVLEFIFAEHNSGPWEWSGVALGILTWCIWGAVFFRLSRSMESTDL